MLIIQRDYKIALLGLSPCASRLHHFISADAASAGRKERKKLEGEEIRSSFTITHMTGRARNVLAKGLFPKVPAPWTPSRRTPTCTLHTLGLISCRPMSHLEPVKLLFKRYKTCPPNIFPVWLRGSGGDEDYSCHLPGCCPVCGAR